MTLIAWGALLAGTGVWGRWLLDRGTDLHTSAPPFTGRFHPVLEAWLIPAVALGAAAVWAGPRVVERLSWRSLLLAGFVVAAAWAVALAVSAGSHGLTSPPVNRGDYLHDVARVGSPGPFLDHFVERIGTYTVHVRSHPPGMLLGLWALDRIGLEGAGWVAALEVLLLASAVPAALLAVREVGGTQVARAAAPFLALAPAAVWAGSGDAVFAGVGTWSAALMVVAFHRTGRRSDLAALAGGALFAASLFLSYGLLLVAPVFLVAAVKRRRVRPVLVAALPVGAAVAAFGAAGFWWPEGLLAGHSQYVESVARLRPYGYFLMANLAAFAVAVGPAAAAGLARLRHRGVWLLVAGGLVAVALADLSGLSKGEVERIWLPFVPWVLVAAVGIARSVARQRLWLGMQVVTALVVQVVLRSPW